jgi:hypothetical protein
MLVLIRNPERPRDKNRNALLTSSQKRREPATVGCLLFRSLRKHMQPSSSSGDYVESPGVKRWSSLVLRLGSYALLAGGFARFRVCLVRLRGRVCSECFSVLVQRLRAPPPPGYASRTGVGSRGSGTGSGRGKGRGSETGWAPTSVAVGIEQEDSLVEALVAHGTRTLDTSSRLHTSRPRAELGCFGCFCRQQ